MITNIPTHKEFEDISKQCLTQALNLLFKVYEDIYEVKEYVDKDEIWSHNAGTIRTSLILLHQGIETIMKGTICKTSPFLLLEKNRADWPTLPSKSDKDFGDLFTISGEALLTTYCAVENKITIDNDLIAFIEDVRKKRNNAIHGISEIKTTAEELFENILKAFSFFFGKDSWFVFAREYNLVDPIFGFSGDGLEEFKIHTLLDVALDIIGRKRLNNYISLNIQGRGYYCPSCKREMEEIDYHESKWAFLKPNKPESKKLQCVVCSSEFIVKREDCNDPDCKGNVIHNYGDEPTCLTCFQEQS